MEEQIQQAEKAIPSEVRIITLALDSPIPTTENPTDDVSSYELPDPPQGRFGGALSSALINVLLQTHNNSNNNNNSERRKLFTTGSNNNNNNNNELNFHQVLEKIREILSKDEEERDKETFGVWLPKLTSSRPLNLHIPWEIVSPLATGGKRALLIGINYVGQKGELTNCHKDALSLKDYIIDNWGFSKENITVLLDDGKHTKPTKANILIECRKLSALSRAGDTVFCHYSGHGGKLRDDNAENSPDKHEETLVPMDYKTAGHIGDDDLFSSLIGPMPKGVTTTFLMDCCYTGTVLDLPFQYEVNDGFAETSVPAEFDFDHLESLSAAHTSSSAGGGSGGSAGGAAGGDEIGSALLGGEGGVGGGVLGDVAGLGNVVTTGRGVGGGVSSPASSSSPASAAVETKSCCTVS